MAEMNGGQRRAVSRRVVRDQFVDEGKVARSRDLRQRMTEAESILWLHLRDRRLDGWRFRRQQVISGFIVDFYCDKAGLVIEIDGGIHDTTRDYDRERDRLLIACDLKVLRLSNDDVIKRLDTTLQRVAQACTHASAGSGNQSGDNS